jgi:hypothetical protein
MLLPASQKLLAEEKKQKIIGDAIKIPQGNFPHRLRGAFLPYAAI